MNATRSPHQPHPAPAALCRIDTELGRITLAATGIGLCGLWFEGQRHLPDLARIPVREDHPLLNEAGAQLRQYFAGQRRAFNLPLDLSLGTRFQQGVWEALRGIEFGSTTTYGTLAARLGRPSAVRAVAAAVGRNPVSVIVPCHRVLGADGALTGYAGGLDRKHRLLELESA